MTTTPDPARELSEALAGAERNEAEMLVRESLRHGELGPVDVSLPIVLAELDRLERVEAAARAVVEHYETTDWDAHEVADYHRQDMLLEALARELTRPAGEDGGGRTFRREVTVSPWVQVEVIPAEGVETDV